MNNNSILDSLLKAEVILEERMVNPLMAPPGFLSWNGLTFLSPETLVTIHGKAGSHKSRLAQEFATTLLQRPDCGQSSKIGLTRSGPSEIMVIYIDSERDTKYELPTALAQIGRDSCVDPARRLFRKTTIRHLKRKVRKFGVEEYLKSIRKEYDGYLCLILDVATDLIMDFNNTQESGEFLDLVKDWMGQYQCAIVLVIHENPGQNNKMRGHLGTEAFNKASDAFGITVAEDDTIKISHKKGRNSKKIHLVNAFLNENTMRLETLAQMYQGPGLESFRARLTGLFTTSTRLSRQDILANTEDLGKSIDSRDNYLKEIDHLIIKDRKYLLSSIREGKETIFVLEPAIAAESR